MTTPDPRAVGDDVPTQPLPRPEDADARRGTSTGTTTPASGAHDDPLRGSRTSGIWVGTVGLGLLLVLLIVFIAQNTEQTTVRFLGFEGQVSVAVALLIATAAGILLTAIAGSLRILQLRHRTKRARKAERRR